MAVVLSTPRYALLSVLTTTLSLTLFVVSQHWPLVLKFVVYGPLSPAERVQFLAELYPFLGPTYRIAHGSLVVLVAVLLGAEVGMIGYQIGELGLVAREGYLGAAGFLLGTIGAGCVACGSAVLGGVTSVLGTAGLLTVVPLSNVPLPLEGKGILLLAVCGLLLAINGMAVSIAGDAACPVDLDR